LQFSSQLADFADTTLLSLPEQTEEPESLPELTGPGQFLQVLFHSLVVGARHPDYV
jgi:hypothetical protein